MEPDIEHVEPLEGYTAQAFANWLRRGFEDLDHDKKRVTAFAPLNYFVFREDDITRELKNIYDLLSGTAKEQFRLGIAIAISLMPPTLKSVTTVSHLLHLAGRVYATEIFPEVVKKIGNGFLGFSEHSKGRELFALSLNIVAGMSPAYGVGDTVRRLVNSSFFQPGYAPMAFVALCRAEPEEFYKHLALLRGSFSALHRNRGTNDAYITAHRFVQYVDLEVIGRNFRQLYLCSKPGIDTFSTDNWLGEAMFIGDNAPLLLDKFHDDYIIARHDKMNWKQISQSHVKINLEKGVQEHRSHLYDVNQFLNQCLKHTWPDQRSDVLNSEELQSKLKEDLTIFIHNYPLYSLKEAAC
jgi:hypothetical protein